MHAYTPQSIQRAIAAGVKCIEHGHLMDEPTAKLMAEKGIWLSTQPFPAEMADAFPPGSTSEPKLWKCSPGRTEPFRLARKYKIKTAFGTDILFSRHWPSARANCWRHWSGWYTPAEILVMATSTNAELWRSGKRNPYPGQLGVMQEGALADLLLVDGNPLEDIGLIADPAQELTCHHERW